jgi:hypothetical protein
MRRIAGFCLVLLTACSASAPIASVAPVTAQAVRELGVAGETLAPGRYARAGFTPRVTFEVGPGWTAEQAAPGFFDVQRDAGTLDVIAVQFGQAVGHESADAAATAIATNEELRVVSGPESVTMAAFDGLRLVVDTADDPATEPPVFRQVLAVAAGPLAIASNRRLEITLLDTSDGLLAILVGGSIRRWDETLDAAAPILASVTIGD